MFAAQRIPAAPVVGPNDPAASAHIYIRGPTNADPITQSLLDKQIFGYRSSISKEATIDVTPLNINDFEGINPNTLTFEPIVERNSSGTAEVRFVIATLHPTVHAKAIKYIEAGPPNNDPDTEAGQVNPTCDFESLQFTKHPPNTPFVLYENAAFEFIGPDGKKAHAQLRPERLSTYRS